MPMPSELKLVEEKMGQLVHTTAIENPHKFLPAEDIKDILIELMNQNKVANAFATGAWKDSAEAKLFALKLDLTPIRWKHAGPMRRRADIVSSAVEKDQEKFGVESFQNICALGDGKWDLLTAQELKMNFVGVDLLKTGRLKNYKHKPQLIITLV